MSKGRDRVADIRLIDHIANVWYVLRGDDCIPAIMFPSHIRSYCNLRICCSQIG